MALGCVTRYTALIRSKEGIPLGDLPVSDVQWGRKLDDFSEAIITVPLSGKECDPCTVIGQLGVWHHELVLFREGEYVWSGPIIRINVSRTQATITARDLFALLDFRIIHDSICFGLACGGAASELTVIGKAIIDNAFLVDGHGYSVFVYNQTNLLGEVLLSPGDHAWERMQEALGLGLDATVLGSRIVIGAAPFGRTDTLTSDDFLVDLEFEVDGLGLATRVITKGGDGLIGIAKAPGSDVNGEHPYYGLLEFEGDDRTELTLQALVDQTALSVLNSRFPAPVTLITPEGAQLSPDAPVAIEDLVPGVLIPVVATDLCLEVSGEYILISLDVSWSQAEGEAVSVTLGTLQSTNNGEGLE